MHVVRQVIDVEQPGAIRARAAIAAGTYGICVDCGAEIPAGRLQAIPDAERCVSCQSLAARRR